MVDVHWEDLRGRELRYRDHTWELTGDVAVRDRGELLAIQARQTDDVRHPRAALYFEIADPSASLNPGNLGVHFDRLERADGEQHLVVKKERRSYRYVLRRLEYE